jgi:hypothetical protein
MQRSGAYDIDITGNERISMQAGYFTPDASNSETSYRVSLPTTLQIDADYHVQKGFYVNLASQISLSNGRSKGFNNKTYSGVTVTPRYETRAVGVYMPVNYNSLTKLNAGFSFRLGPFFAGSGSIVSSLLGQSKQADVYFGFRIGNLK